MTGTVEKYRRILRIDDVKFHLDRVAALGSFVEIEATDHTGTIAGSSCWSRASTTATSSASAMGSWSRVPTSTAPLRPNSDRPSHPGQRQ